MLYYGEYANEIQNRSHVATNPVRYDPGLTYKLRNLFLCSVSGQRYHYCLSEIVPFWDSFFEFLARYIHFTISKLGHSQIGNSGIFVPDKLHRNKLLLIMTLLGQYYHAESIGNGHYVFWQCPTA